MNETHQLISFYLYLFNFLFPWLSLNAVYVTLLLSGETNHFLFNTQSPLGLLFQIELFKQTISKTIVAVFYYTGCILYQKGYIDTSLDVKTARYKKGGAIKYIGFFTSMFSTISLAYSMITA